METKNTFYLSNGFAAGNNFTANIDEAIKIAEDTSVGMCTRCWLHMKDAEGKWIELGHTYHKGPMEWKFRRNG